MFINHTSIGFINNLQSSFLTPHSNPNGHCKKVLSSCLGQAEFPARQVTFHSFRCSLQNVIYEFMTDHRSYMYTHGLSSCEIKAWKKNQAWTGFEPMDCRERYKFMIDHHSYTHNLSSCEIKASVVASSNWIGCS